MGDPTLMREMSIRALVDAVIGLDRWLRHGATCALEAERDNSPLDTLCTCGLREAFLRSRAAVTLRAALATPDTETAEDE